MQLVELLSAERIAIWHDGANSGPAGPTSLDKKSIIAHLATMLAVPSSLAKEQIEQVLLEREALQSTGIGEGVAIPHAALSDLNAQRAALLIVPSGVEFEAIDGSKVTILFAVIGPKRATGEHLKTLARVSRLLRNETFRNQLTSADNPESAYRVLQEAERGYPS